MHLHRVIVAGVRIIFQIADQVRQASARMNRKLGGEKRECDTSRKFNKSYLSIIILDVWEDKDFFQL